MISIPSYSFQILIISKYIHFKGCTVEIDKILTPTLSVNILTLALAKFYYNLLKAINY